MSIALSGSELINIAIGIERRGIAFYELMAKSSKNQVAVDVFKYLADMERQHIKIFQDMITEVGSFKISERSGEYGDYLQALVDSAVFTDEFVTSETTARATSDIEVLELAIGAEKDSILFYYEMKDILPKPAQSAVDRIINEEKSHLRQLTELKKKLAVI